MFNEVRWLSICSTNSKSTCRRFGYRSKVMRGSGGRAFSTGYRSLTAILTSSTSAVRNRRRFRMVYSWSARMMLPWRWIWTDHQIHTHTDTWDASMSWFSMILNKTGCYVWSLIYISHNVFSPCHTVQWSSGRQPHLSQTGCQQSCRSRAA